MSATIIPLRREERIMSNEYDDIPVPERELEAWKQIDTVDTDAFGDKFFERLAQDIERAAAAPPADVIPLRSRRPVVYAAVALAAALLLGLGLLLREPTTTAPDGIVTTTEEPTPSIEDIARVLGASAMAAVLEGADEDESATLLASREWTTSEDDDLLPISYGSLLEGLDDVDDYDSFFPL